MTPTHGNALGSVRVVELGTGVAAAVAGMIFGDYGADVVLVEPPGGDGLRANPGTAVWHRNKGSAVVDLDGLDGERSLGELLSSADVCICGGGQVGRRDDLVAAARAANPRLIVLHLDPYSPHTPWFGREESSELVSAVTGLALRQSSVEDVPVDPVYPHVLYVQGVWGATCAIAALIERETSGVGQVVTVDSLQAALISGSVTSVVNPAEATRPVVPAGPGGPSPCYSRYVCADGRWLFLGALSAKFQHRALELLDLEDLLQDLRIGGDLDRLLAPDNNRWVRAALAERFRTRPRDEWLDLLDAADCPAGPLLAREEWLDHPQIRAIGMRVEIEDPERGSVVMPGVPLVLSATPGAVHSPSPRLGELRQDWVGWSPRPEHERVDAADPAVGRGPLCGVRVLNLGTVLAGPFAGQLLSDLGADVVKVEPVGGDPFRVRGFAFNRGARSLAVDLRSDRGRDLFYDLVATADVVLDNYRPGVLARLRIDYPELVKANHRIVTMSLTGFGEGGPLSARPGFDPVLQAMSGMMSAQGGDGEPVFLTTAVNDVAAACFAALGACLGIFHRTCTGEGQAISGSLAAFSAFMQSGELVRFSGRVPARRGGTDFQGPSALDRYYRASNGWVRLQASPDQVPELARAGWLPAPGTGALADEELHAALMRSFADRDANEAVAQLAELSIPAAIAIRPVDLLANPSVRGSETFHEYPLAGGGSCFAPGRSSRFSRTQQAGVLVSPGLGEHSRELLRDLGRSGQDVKRLLDDRIVVEQGPLQLPILESYR
ncbi:CoA transferase [Nocardioides sp.]|uniref:CoA transferase n=1 Tax=Nocardioides sp. TaxID=35761 RepID=UPI003D0E58A7